MTKQTKRAATAALTAMRQAADDLNDIAAEHRGDAEEELTSIAQLKCWLVNEEDRDVHDQVFEILALVATMLDDAKDVELIAKRLERGHARAAFRAFEDLDTAVRDAIWTSARFVKLYEADPDSVWTTNNTNVLLGNSHVPREVL